MKENFEDFQFVAIDFRKYLVENTFQRGDIPPKHQLETLVTSYNKLRPFTSFSVFENKTYYVLRSTELKPVAVLALR